MNDREYNGWTNYETWAANLELIDDEAEILRSSGVRFSTVNDLRDHLEASTLELVNDAERDYPVAHAWAIRSLEHVNWREIAEHYPELIEPQPDIPGDGYQ